jgi:hypothetical protein
MPRPWEYTPRRHLLMQVVMWVVLCVTLGVAYGVSRRLSAPTGQEVQIGPIAFRLPDGFTLEHNPEADVQARDARGRVLLVGLLPNRRDDRSMSDQSSPIDFRGINQTGRLLILKGTLSSPDGESSQLTFSASASLPNLNQQVVLVLQVVEEEGSDLTADRVILQKIANSVTLTGVSPTPRKRDHSKDTVVLQSIPSRGARS